VTAHDDAAPIARGLLLHATADEDLIFEALAEVDRLVARIEQLATERDEANAAKMIALSKTQTGVITSSESGALVIAELQARIEQAERERDEARKAIYDRDEYGRTTGCDCHERSAGDPDYTPAFQDEYQRLWHEAAARADRAENDLLNESHAYERAMERAEAAEARVAQLEGALRLAFSIGHQAWCACDTCAPICAALDAARPADIPDWSKCNCGAGPSGIHSRWCSLAATRPADTKEEAT
jgi:hypothetical protein